MTKAALSRECGVSQVAVHKWVKRGLPVRPDGSLDDDEARAWVARNRVAKTAKSSAKNHRARPKAAKVAEPRAAEDFAQARTRREIAEANRAEIRAAKDRGELAEVDEVRRTWHAIGRMFSAAREAIPAQLAPRLIALTDLEEIERILKAALRAADDRIADEIQSRFGNLAGSK